MGCWFIIRLLETYDGGLPNSMTFNLHASSLEFLYFWEGEFANVIQQVASIAIF